MTWADRFVASINARDVDALRTLVDEGVQVRVDGALVAPDREAAEQQLAVHLAAHGDEVVAIRDLHVAGDTAYVLYETGGAARSLAYGILELRDDRLVAATCYLGARLDESPITIDLRGPEAVVEPSVELAPEREPAREPEPEPRTWRGRLAVPLTAIGSWIVQDLLLAAPVVAFAARYGSLEAYAVFAPAYALLSLVLTFATLRLLRRPRPAHPGRFSRWLASAEHHPRTLQLLRAGGVVGFVLSSYLLSGPPTVWALHRLGVRRRLPLYGILASVTWGLTFVLSYLLVAEVAFL